MRKFERRWLLLLLFIVFLVSEIFFFKSVFDLAIIALWILWIICLTVLKFKDKVSILAGVVFLCLLPLLLIIKEPIVAEKISNWAFIFLLTGTIQKLVKYN